MKITEFITEWSTTSERNAPVHYATRFFDPAITEVMLQKGYKKLGSGQDQVAFLGSDGTVLKIFKTNKNSARGGFSEGQRMGVEWITYCQKNSNNPFLPKFSGFESFEFPPDSGSMYLQIRMEKLGKVPNDWHYQLENIADKIDDHWSINTYLDEYLPDDRADTNEATATLMLHLGIEEFKQLWTTLVVLNRVCSDNDWVWDLHSGNYMSRNDGTPVILDPYFLGHDK